MVRVKAYAKVNLTLEITGEKDGYHTLDSLVASIDLFDFISLKKRKDNLSSVTMRGLGSESIPPESNNALKAAEAFSEKFGVGGADITVYKNIPIGAGLGGSSADASGVLIGMAKLYGIEDINALRALADTLGSDTKYMLDGGFARMRGRGDRVERVDTDLDLHLLLFCPKSTVSSGAAYRKYDAMQAEKNTGAHTENCLRAIVQKDAEGVGRYLMNDLFLPATALNGDVRKAQEAAESFSPLGVTMTGSGSAVLALFENKELCEWAKSRYRGEFKTLVVKTLTPKPVLGRKTGGWRNPFVLSESEQDDCKE